MWLDKISRELSPNQLTLIEVAFGEGGSLALLTEGPHSVLVTLHEASFGELFPQPRIIRLIHRG